jgi:hypothetical protein
LDLSDTNKNIPKSLRNCLKIELFQNSFELSITSLSPQAQCAPPPPPIPNLKHWINKVDSMLLPDDGGQVGSLIQIDQLARIQQDLILLFFIIFYFFLGGGGFQKFV